MMIQLNQASIMRGEQVVLGNTQSPQMVGQVARNLSINHSKMCFKTNSLGREDREGRGN
jgi:hypothetical protein